MGKAVRNRRLRKRAYLIGEEPSRTRSIARALRRHGRMPLPKREGQL